MNWELLYFFDCFKVVIPECSTKLSPVVQGCTSSYSEGWGRWISSSKPACREDLRPIYVTWWDLTQKFKRRVGSVFWKYLWFFKRLEFLLDLTTRVNHTPQSHLRQLTYSVHSDCLSNLLLREWQWSSLFALDFPHSQLLQSKWRHSGILSYLVFHAPD